MTLSVIQDSPCIEPVAPPNVSSSSFRSVSVLEHVSLLHCYVGRVAQGVLEHLNEKVFRFSNQLGGVVLSYSRPQVLQRCGAILDEQPYIHIDVKYTVCLFKPELGSLLSGIVNNVGQDHLGCLVHNCFNAAVLAPSSLMQESSWFTRSFDTSSLVWFTVTSMDNVDGIVSITGEYVDVSCPFDSIPFTKTPIDMTSSATTTPIDMTTPIAMTTSVVSTTPVTTEGLSSSTKKAKRKKRKRINTDSDDSYTSKAKRTKISYDSDNVQINTNKQTRVHVNNVVTLS